MYMTINVIYVIMLPKNMFFMSHNHFLVAVMSDC